MKLPTMKKALDGKLAEIFK